MRIDLSAWGVRRRDRAARRDRQAARPGVERVEPRLMMDGAGVSALDEALPALTFKGKNAKSDAAAYPQEVFDVIRTALQKAGETDGAQVTSTVRSPRKQAEVMYDNNRQYGTEHQLKLYGPEGDKVVEMAATRDQKGEPRKKTIDAMENLIKRLGPSKVSHHVSDRTFGSSVIDIGSSSIKVKNRQKFEEALLSDPRVNPEKFFGPGGKNGRTKGKESAYHIEIFNDKVFPPTPPPVQPDPEDPPPDYLGLEPDEHLVFDDDAGFEGEFEFLDDDFFDDEPLDLDGLFFDEFGNEMGEVYYDYETPESTEPSLYFSFYDPTLIAALTPYFLYSGFDPPSFGGGFDPAPAATFTFATAPSAGQTTQRVSTQTKTQQLNTGQSTLSYAAIVTFSSGQVGDVGSYKTYNEAQAAGQKYMNAYNADLDKNQSSLPRINTYSVDPRRA